MADAESRAGAQQYATPAIQEYLRELYAPEDAAMRDALAQIQAAGLPAIQVGHTEGKILQVLLRLVGARRVVEIGTLAGYSALWICRALPADGHLWTCEANPKHAAIARGVFERAGLASKITVLDGPALESLARLELEAPFDAVFVDANKDGYRAYGEWATRTLGPGGLLIGDNAYLFGALAGREPDQADSGRAASSEEIASMRGFHELLASRFDAVCLPTPDGLAIGMLRDLRLRR